MAFLPVIPTSGRTLRGKRVRLYCQRSGKHLDRYRLTVAISRELLEALHWHPGDRVVFALGTGDDRGNAQLSRVDKPTGGHKLTLYSKSRVARIAVTLPANVHGEDIAALLDPFTDPDDVDFAVANGAVHFAFAPRRAALSEAVPLRIVAGREG